jgi:hypothetical protein
MTYKYDPEKRKKASRNSAAPTRRCPSESQTSGPTVGENPAESMLHTWLEAFSTLLETLHAIFAEPQFENDAFRAVVKRGREAFGELFSVAEIGGKSPGDVSGLSAKAGDRERYIDELTALATFIGTFNKASGKHVFELASKLSDLNKGRDDPLFEPAKVRVRRRDRSTLWQARARVVLAVEALIRTGTTPGKAEEIVIAQLHQEFFVPAGKKGKTIKPSQTLRQWRKSFNNKRVSDLEGRIVFEEGLMRIKNAIAASDLAAIENIVQRTAQDISSTVF